MLFYEEFSYVVTCQIKKIMAQQREGQREEHHLNSKNCRIRSTAK